MANWPVKAIVGDGIQVEFWKPSNLDLSRINRHFIGVAGKMSTVSEEEATAVMLNAPTYEEDRGLLFKTVSVDGFGFIDDMAKLDKFLDKYGINAEIILYAEAFKTYLGGAYGRFSVAASSEQKTATTPETSSPAMKSSGSSTAPSRERLPRGAK